MDKRFLEECLAKGMSLPQIGKLAGKDPSTVGYWVQKHGLRANGRDKHAPRGGIVEGVLEIMVEDGLTLQEMANELECSPSTVRHWLNRYGLKTANGRGRRSRREVLEAMETGLREVQLECRHHGLTLFSLQGRGYFRCKRCRSEAVARRRRKVKQQLVENAGGACVICGYDEYVSALQFHHLNPEDKEFHIAQGGYTRSLARCRDEARKCILLCANCHAAVEAGQLQVPLELKELVALPV